MRPDARGRSGERKKVILLTATPINNTIFDLYNQINLFTGNDRTYFAAAGIGDLYRYFLSARQKSIDEGSIQIFNLLEEVVIRRTLVPHRLSTSSPIEVANEV